MSSTLAEQLRAALVSARKDRDKARTLLYSTTLSELKNREFELGHEADDDAVVDVLRKAVKKRGESVEQYRAAGRQDLAEREAFEIKELERHLPPSLSDAEIRDAVKAAVAEGAANLGAVMGKVMPHLKGRADGKLINQIAREVLAG